VSGPRVDVSVCVYVWGGLCSGSGVGQDESKTSMQKAEELKRNMQQVPVLFNSSLTSHRSAWYLKVEAIRRDQAQYPHLRDRRVKTPS
jgi:hypothetical protein